MTIQTDIYSLVGLAAGAFAFVLAWLLLHRRRERGVSVEMDGQESFTWSSAG